MKARFCVALLAIISTGPAAGGDAQIRATRFTENPLITLASAPSIGDNANGPTVIRVPAWVQKPLGRYYMYFAHHKGQFIRLAYANSVHGPWTVYEPGVMKVQDTAFYRPQPDPAVTPPGVYTHVASPEIYIDDAKHQIVMWFHGMWTEGQRWPDTPAEATPWLRQRGYAQYTQASVSSDGLHFETRPAISRQTYLRVFQHRGEFYAFARLGQMLHAKDPLQEFELGDSPFRGTRYANRVRHVALLEEGDLLHVFFTVIGDAPETILHTTMALAGDWKEWKIGDVSKVLEPGASYECLNLPNEPSEVGEIDHPARQLRDPAIFQEAGKTYLFYTFCGEQGVAGAEVTLGAI